MYIHVLDIKIRASHKQNRITTHNNNKHKQTDIVYGCTCTCTYKVCTHSDCLLLN